MAVCISRTPSLICMTFYQIRLLSIHLKTKELLYMTRTTVRERVAKDLCRLGLHAADPGAGGSNIGMCERTNTISGGGIVRGHRGIVSVHL